MTIAQWTDEDKASAARMWAKGASAFRISIAFDCTEYAVIRLTRRNRSMFPPRPPGPKPVRFKEQPDRKAYQEEQVPRALPTINADRVRRTTISGAKVTLPRVPFIDGHYQEAAE